MSTFTGSIEQLKAAVEATAIDGAWEEKPNHIWRFRAKDGAGLNWSSTKGTLWFDGPEAAKNQMVAVVDVVLGSGAALKVDESRTIFVVHGHDSDAREQLELVLHRLGLKPYVLQNTDGGGLTIIERLEQMIGKKAASSFGIVLLTPRRRWIRKSRGGGSGQAPSAPERYFGNGDAASISNARESGHLAKGLYRAPI
jgi:hypothetical protein